MNLPNKLTIFRVFLIPVFVLAYYLVGNPWLNAVIFVVASLTDTADGYIARKYNLVTNFGKFADPLADKLLVCTAMICMIADRSFIFTIAVIVIIAREFIISGFRAVAADNNIVIAASWWGKIKTIVQMIMIVALLLNFDYAWFKILCDVLIYLAVALTVISMVDYLYKNRQVLKDGVK